MNEKTENIDKTKQKEIESKSKRKTKNIDKKKEKVIEAKSRRKQDREREIKTNKKIEAI